MSHPLWEHLSEVAARVAATSHLLLGLDDDNLLEETSTATLEADTRATISVLAAQTNSSTVILSGGRLEELRKRIGIDGVTYVGNRGLEISGPEISFTEPTAADVQRTLGWLAIVLSQGLINFPGVVVENKGLTLSVHFRQVDAAKAVEVVRHVQAAVAVTRDYFHVTRGRHSLDVRPSVDWHNGTAMRWIAAQLGKPEALIIYMGRDASNEDAFQALADGISIKVGEPGLTAAHYHVESTAAVREFLDWLAQLRQLHATAPGVSAEP